MKNAMKTLIAVAMVAVPLTGTANALPVLPGQISVNQLHADISQSNAFSGEAKVQQVGLKKYFKQKKIAASNARAHSATVGLR